MTEGVPVNTASKMPKGNKKRFSAGEVIEAFFIDEDSNDEDFYC